MATLCILFFFFFLIKEELEFCCISRLGCMAGQTYTENGFSILFFFIFLLALKTPIQQTAGIN